jgi:hypothetical protein
MTFKKFTDHVVLRPLPKATLLLIAVNFFFFYSIHSQPQTQTRAINNMECVQEVELCTSEIRAFTLHNFILEQVLNHTKPDCTQGKDGILYDFYCPMVQITNNSCLVKNQVIHLCYSRSDINDFYLGFTPAIFMIEGNKTWMITAMFSQKNFFYLLFTLVYFFLISSFIERRIGSLRTILVYIAGSLGACGLYYFFSQDSLIPMMGITFSVSGAHWTEIYSYHYRMLGQDSWFL